MSTRVVSEIYKIDSPIDDVYAVLSYFKKIGSLFNMAKQMNVGNNDERLAKAKEYIEDVRFEDDVCYLTVKKIGQVEIVVVEREEPKLVKLEANLPFHFNLWIQLLDKGPYDTRVKLTFDGDLNMMMKMLIKGKLKKGLDQFAEGMTRIPFSMIKNM